MLKKMIIFIFFIAMCLISFQTINAANITVHPGDSIQKAVDKASNGDTILVYDNNQKPYTYKESVYINKKINLKASGNVTVIARNNCSAVFTVNPSGSGTIIQKFILYQDNYCSSYCIMINKAKNCIISCNLIKASLVGIQFYGNINNTLVSRNTITGSNKNFGNGISFESGSCTYNSIKENTISNFLNGILFNDKSDHNKVLNNKIYGYGLHGAGIYATDNSKYMEIMGNTVIGYEDGIAIQQIGTNTATNYQFRENTVKGNKNGLWVRVSNSVISKNIATQNRVSGLDITGRYNYIASNNATKNGICGICLGRYYSKDLNIITKNSLTYNLAGINSASHYTTISNNYVCNNTNNGIISTANHTTITGNTILNTASRIIISGTNNMVQKN